MLKYLYPILFFLSSCSVYSPQKPIPVLIEKKGDIEIDGGISVPIFELSPIINTSFSYGLTDKIQGQLSG